MAALLRQQVRLVRESFRRFTEEAVELRRVLWPCSEATDSSWDDYESDEEEAEDRKWKDKKYEILKDIKPVLLLTKDILSSQRYMDGAVLTVEDEQVVVKRLLAYHPHYEDKIGCGLESILVDRHPIFRHSRCLFVVRTDGGWIDFSHQKCLQKYIIEEYPTHAERFIRENRHISALKVIGPDLINWPKVTQGEKPELRIPRPTRIHDFELPC